jgi:transcriptional regulator with XRE-family HTH domain
MGVNKRPTPRQRLLGAALREARQAKGLTLRDLASKVETSYSALSRWENAERTPPPTDVARILTTLDITGERYDEILALTQHAEAPNWLAVSLPEQRRHLSALLRFEKEAQRITSVTPLIISGLLQTHGYVEAIMTGGGVPDDEVDTRVAIRLGRAKVLSHVKLTVVLGEAAMRQQIGGPRVLADQLRHLIHMSESVDLRVIPYTAGWNPALEGSWTVIEFKAAPTVIHMENRRSGLFLHEEEDVATYHEATASAMEAAMSPTDTRELITASINELESR